MISVAVATYNGAAFLEEQFESLFAQTRQPDEVVVYDDASSDNTLALLADLQARAPFRMKVIAGETNKHVNGAFDAALLECKGQIIFFCDQDDIWEPAKIANFMDCFERDSNVGIVFCDASQIDCGGRAIDISLWESVHFTRQRRRHFKRDPLAGMLRGGNFIYGMASAFRIEAIQPFHPVRSNPRAMTHDTWFALHTLALGWKGVMLQDHLVRYRQHANQATKKDHLDKSVGRRELLASRRCAKMAQIEALTRVRDGIAEASIARSEAARVNAIGHLQDKIDHLALRESLRDKRSLPLILQAFTSLGYWRYARGPYSILRDIFGF